MADYDKFARFYDVIMGVPKERITTIRNLIKQYRPRAQSVLELGCGTGSVLAGLAESYQVSGLDRSPRMLEIAQTKLPEAKFYLGDMAEFRLRQRFDVIICVFDSINHLLQFEQWQTLFKCAFDHLNQGGVLIFDMNTISRLKAVARVPFEEEFEGGKWLVSIVETRGVFVWNLDFLENLGNGKFKKHSENISETAFRPEVVIAELKKRFEIKLIQDATGGSANSESARIYFVVKKLAT